MNGMTELVALTKIFRFDHLYSSRYLPFYFDKRGRYRLFGRGKEGECTMTETLEGLGLSTRSKHTCPICMEEAIVERCPFCEICLDIPTVQQVDQFAPTKKEQKPFAELIRFSSNVARN
jgi:hypothetical protein